jgi:hypothetical protein
MHIDGNLLPPEKKKENMASSDPNKKNDNKPLPAVKELKPDTTENMVVIVEAVKLKDLSTKQQEAEQKLHTREGVKELREGKGLAGRIKQILIQRPEAGGKSEALIRKGDSVEDGKKRLAAELRTILADNPAGSETEIDIKADGELDHRFFIELYDICKTKYYIEEKNGRKFLQKIDPQHPAPRGARVLGYAKVGFIPPDNIAKDEDEAPAK